MTNAPKLMTTPQLAEYLNGIVSVRTIQGWRRAGKGPDFIEAEGQVLYDLTDVRRWLRQKRRRPARTAA